MDQNLLTALSIGALDQADQDPRDRALRLWIRTMTDENCVAALAMTRGRERRFYRESATPYRRPGRSPK